MWNEKILFLYFSFCSLPFYSISSRVTFLVEKMILIYNLENKYNIQHYGQRKRNPRQVRRARFRPDISSYSAEFYDL